MCKIRLEARQVLTPLRICDQYKISVVIFVLHHHEQPNRGHYCNVVSGQLIKENYQ